MLFIVFGPPAIDKMLEELENINNLRINPGMHMMEMEIPEETENPAEAAKLTLNGLHNFDGESVVIQPSTWSGFGNKALVKKMEALSKETKAVPPATEKTAQTEQAEQPSDEAAKRGHPEGD